MTITEVTTLDEIFTILENTNDKTVVLFMYSAAEDVCQRVGPIFKKMSVQHQAKIEFVEVEVNDVVGSAKHFDVTHLPTFVAVLQEKEVSRYVGVTEERLARFLLRVLKEADAMAQENNDGSFPSTASTTNAKTSTGNKAKGSTTYM